MRSDKELEKDQMKEKTEHMCKKMKKEDLLLYAVTDVIQSGRENAGRRYDIRTAERKRTG